MTEVWSGICSTLKITFSLSYDIRFFQNDFIKCENHVFMKLELFFAPTIFSEFYY